MSEHVDVLVVGAGPAGLAAGAALARRGAGKVVLIDREPEAGGIPRHAHHQGYGLRDLHRSMSGPDYARRRVALALDAGAEIRVATQATGWTDAGGLALTGPAGPGTISASATVLAAGCRERPRAARLVPGSRPQGVMTTGMLQQLVYLAGKPAGRRAVVVGAEHVSYSALLTLAHGGAETVAMTTELPRHQTFAAFHAGAAVRFRAPLRTRTAITDIRGRRRVEAVELTHLDSGETQLVACDTVIFTGDWVPDHELAVLADADLDPGTRGPAVDAALRTSRPGLFSTGNVLHGAETADVAALTGAHVATGVLEHLAGSSWPTARVPVVCREPLHWITPNVVTAAGAPARGRYLLRAREHLLDVHVRLEQDGRRLARHRLSRLVPGRSARLPSEWATAVDPAGSPVTVRIERARRRGQRPSSEGSREA